MEKCRVRIRLTKLAWNFTELVLLERPLSFKSKIPALPQQTLLTFVTFKLSNDDILSKISTSKNNVELQYNDIVIKEAWSKKETFQKKIALQEVLS